MFTVDNDEIKSLYAAHAKSVYNYILWMTRDADLARDILQTVFIKAWQSPTFPSPPEERNKWLFTAARNGCYDSFRFKARHNHFRSRYSYACNHENDDAHDGVFWELLAQCTQTERSILYLHLKMGYSYAEIAPILDLSQSNVRVRVCRAMKMLREHFTRSGRHER